MDVAPYRMTDAEEKQLMAEIAIEREVLHRKNLRSGIRIALSERCKGDQRNMNRATRWLYVLKLMTCIAIGLDRRRLRHDEWCCLDSVQCGTVFMRRDSYGWDGVWIVVGIGLFRNWWFAIEEDGE